MFLPPNPASRQTTRLSRARSLRPPRKIGNLQETVAKEAQKAHHPDKLNVTWTWRDTRLNW